MSVVKLVLPDCVSTFVYQIVYHLDDNSVNQTETHPRLLTSLSTGGQLVELIALTWEIWVPMTRCTLQQSLHSSTPLLIDAQEGSGPGQVGGGT